MCICLCMCIHIRICTEIRICICTGIRICTYKYACIHYIPETREVGVCVFLYGCICMCVPTQKGALACMWKCLYASYLIYLQLYNRVCTNVHAYECMCVQFATRAPTPAPLSPPLYTHVRYRRIHTGHSSNSVLNTTSLTQRTADAAVGCAGAAHLAIHGACD